MPLRIRLAATAVALASVGSVMLTAPTALATTAPTAATSSSQTPTSTRDLGTYQGHTVTVATYADGHRVLFVPVGKKHVRQIAIPSGAVRYSVMTGSIVNQWVQDGVDLVHWTYDLATHRTTTQRLTNAEIFAWRGGTGFWAVQTAADGTAQDVLHTWDGKLLYTQPDSLRANTSFMTATAAYVRVDGANPTGVAVIPTNGDPVKVWGVGMPVVSIEFPNLMDDTAATVVYLDASGTRQRCTLSENGSTCPGGWRTV